MNYNFDTVIFLNIRINNCKDIRKGYLTLNIKNYPHIDFQKIPNSCLIRIAEEEINREINKEREKNGKEINETKEINHKLNTKIHPKFNKKINKIHFHGESLPIQLFDDWYDFMEKEFYPQIINFLTHKDQQIMDDLSNKYVVKQFGISIEIN